MSLPQVYLAGPISGCNSEQRHSWRESLKRGFAEEFRFIDPTENLIGSEESDYAVVQADMDAIQSADAILANMWRESIGTSLGVLHGHLAGKIVVVNDPNFIQSRLLAFYSDAVETDIYQGLNRVRSFLRAQNSITAVEKVNGFRERFNRNKLLLSVRRACLAAGASDIVPARAIVAETLSVLLVDRFEQEVVKSAIIKDAVWKALAQLGSDPTHDTDYEAIRLAWQEYESAGSGKQTKPRLAVPVIHDQPLSVPLRNTGGHSLVWGNRIGGDALKIFEEISRIDGITEIVFGRFANTGAPPSKAHVRLQASNKSGSIDGRCYDHGKKGTLQMFEIHVANKLLRDTVLGTLRKHLTERGMIRPERTSPSANESTKPGPDDRGLSA